MNYGNRVTMIDELPELNDVENGMHNTPSVAYGQGGYARVGGAVGPPRAAPGYQLAHNPHIGENLPPQVAQKYQRLIRQASPINPQSGMAPYNVQPTMENYEPEEQPMHDNLQSSNSALTRISCLDIADHVKQCPICSKFYNNDKTIYIIVIVVLTIIVLLLLKKVLDV